MPRATRPYSEITDDRVASAIRAGQGSLHAAARILGIPRGALERRVARSLELAELMRDYAESLVDMAELQLRKLVNEGDFASIKLVLERRGATRGWGRAPVDVDLTLRGANDPRRDQRIANLPEHVLTSVALAIGADGLVDGLVPPEEQVVTLPELEGDDVVEAALVVPPPEELAAMRDEALSHFEPDPPLVDFNQPAPAAKPKSTIDDLLQDFDFDGDIDAGMSLGESSS